MTGPWGVGRGVGVRFVAAVAAPTSNPKAARKLQIGRTHDDGTTPDAAESTRWRFRKAGAAGILCGTVRKAAVLILLLFAAACGPGRPPAPPVVIISIDTLRANRLPAYGYGKVATPHLDRFRRDAVLFENAYAHVPQTLPSHASLFTGLYPAQHGVRDNAGFSLSTGPTTLASRLKERGYATGAAVSAAVMESKSGIARGFDSWDDAMPPGVLKRDGAESARSLAAWIGRQRGPFLAFLHIFEPHAPREAPEPYRSRYADPYDAEVARADAIVGAFLEDLRRLKLYDRSLIIVLSDHGEGLGDHGEDLHGVLLYREAIHVPLLLKLPGARHAGRTVPAAVGLVDVFPTVAGLLHLPAMPGLPGISLMSYLEGEAPAPRRIFSETLYPRLRMGWSDLASLADLRFHYIEGPDPELYDLANDPAERRNLVQIESAALRERKAELSGISRPFEMPRPADAEKVRTLASLGYLTGISPDASRLGLPDPKAKIAAGAFASAPAIEKLFGSGRDEKLAAACRQYVTVMPGALDMWRTLAGALDRLGRTREAVAALEQGLKLSRGTALPSEQAITLELLATLRARR